MLLLFVVLAAGCAERQDQRLKVRVTSLGIPDTPWHDFWLRFAETLEARDEAGEIDLDLFISGELGRRRDRAGEPAPGADTSRRNSHYRGLQP